MLTAACRLLAGGAAALAVLLLAGCTLFATPEPAPAGAPETAAEAAPVPVDPERLKRLLWAAEDALLTEHIVHPAAGSALEGYREVLALDPGNLAARRGLERIVEHFLSAAQQALQSQNYIYAESMLDRARAVDPEHPGIEPAAAQVELLQSARREVLKLDQQHLTDRSAELARRLRGIGERARADDCRVLLYARNDAEGRWMYQKMNETTGSERIAAELLIAWPARIEVLCLDT